MTTSLLIALIPIAWGTFSLYAITEEMDQQLSEKCKEPTLVLGTADVSPVHNRSGRSAPQQSQCNSIRDYYLFGVQVCIPKNQVTTVSIPLTALRRRGESAEQFSDAYWYMTNNREDFRWQTMVGDERKCGRLTC